MFKKLCFIYLSLLFIALGARAENPEVIKCPKATAAFRVGDYVLSHKEATTKACPKLKILARWQQLLKNQSTVDNLLTLKDYQNFIDKNPNFPNKRDLYVAAEKNISVDTPWIDLKKWFENKSPLNQKVMYLYYFGSKRPPISPEELKKLRTAWALKNLSSEFEKKLIDLFKEKGEKVAFFKRASYLIEAYPKTAERFLKEYENKLPQDKKRLLKTLLAFSLKDKNALKQVSFLSKKHQNYERLVLSHFKFLVNQSSPDVLPLLRRNQKIFQKNRRKIPRLIHISARDAITRKEYQVAFDILEVLSFERKIYLIEINFLKGLLLLEFLKRPGDALSLFQFIADNSSQPGTLSQGYYWLARAQGVLGAKKQRVNALEKATHHRQTYYGQLAVDELGRSYETKMMDIKRDQVAQETVYALPEASYALLLWSLNRMDLVPPFLYKIFYKRSSQKNTHAFLNALVLFSHDFFPGYTYDMARLWGVSYKHPLTYGGRPEVFLYEDPAFLSAVIRKESGLNELAISPAGARGLMQLMEGTALKIAKDLGIDVCNKNIENLLLEDPELNVRLGAHYIKNKLDQFRGSKELMLAGYNAGPLNAQKWIKRYGDFRKGVIDRIVWIELIPFYETRDYVKRVMANYRVYNYLEKKLLFKKTEKRF